MRARARQGGANLRELMERVEELGDIGKKNKQLPHRQVRGQHLLSAHPGHPERARAQDHRDRAPVEDLETLLRHLLLPRRFRVGSLVPRLARRGGTLVSLSLSEPARVTLSSQRWSATIRRAAWSMSRRISAASGSSG